MESIMIDDNVYWVSDFRDFADLIDQHMVFDARKYFVSAVEEGDREQSELIEEKCEIIEELQGNIKIADDALESLIKELTDAKRINKRDIIDALEKIRMNLYKF